MFYSKDIICHEQIIGRTQQYQRNIKKRRVLNLRRRKMGIRKRRLNVKKRCLLSWLELCDAFKNINV